MPDAPPEQRQLAAIMFTDMVGYSALAQGDQALALELLEEHRQIARSLFPRFNGTEIKTIGDAFLVEFHSALEAAQCAIEIQRTLAKRNHDVPADRRIEVKIGIHIGDVVHRDGDVYGDGVNIASRIEQLAGAGGICVSMDVERQIRNALEARFEKLAPTELKNISVAMDLFRIVLPWEQRTSGVAKSGATSVARPTMRTFAATAVALLLLVIGIGWWWTTQPRRTLAAVPPSGSHITSLAVLPFKNYSGDTNQEYFADGITDLLTTELSSIGAVTVNVQLIEARTDRHLWARKFERDVTNILKMRNEVVEAIAHEIQAAISPEQSSRLSSARSVNPDALQDYLLGRQAWSRQNEKGLNEALEHFNRAKEVDPEFALAWAGLADVYWTASDANIPATEAGLKAKAAADRTLQLDDSLAEAHTAEGAIAANDFRWADSDREFHRAIKLNPN